MRRLLTAALAAAGLALATAACGGDDDGTPAVSGPSTVEPNTTTSAPPPPAEVRLTKEEYIRQGDALCAEADRKWTDIARAQDRAPEGELLRYDEQTEMVQREMVTRFAALKAPLADQPVADQLNGLLQQNLAKEGERIAALRAEDDAAAERLIDERENLDRQFAQAAAQYGFVQCPRIFAGT
jgi:hypothetical protein